MNELSVRLKKEARAIGLCDQWFSEWEDDATNEELIGKFKRGIDFCVKHDFPSVEACKAFFDRGMLRRNSIYVDDTIYTSEASMPVIMGNSKVTMVNDDHPNTIYVRHDSHLDITVGGCLPVFIHLYDRASLRVHCHLNSKAFVYIHGDNEVEQSGDVRLRRK